MTESVSGSLAAGLWILYFHDGPPALLTDALMKEKTELDGEHGPMRTRWYYKEREEGERISCSKKVTL